MELGCGGHASATMSRSAPYMSECRDADLPPPPACAVSESAAYDVSTCSLPVCKVLQLCDLYGGIFECADVVEAFFHHYVEVPYHTVEMLRRKFTFTTSKYGRQIGCICVAAIRSAHRRTFATCFVLWAVLLDRAHTVEVRSLLCRSSATTSKFVLCVEIRYPIPVLSKFARR